MSTLHDTDRYERQWRLAGIGPEGQAKIRRARVLIVGAGGLGSPVALYLTAAGTGTIGIADDDAVALSNLQRQVIHDTLSLDVPKVESARRNMVALNPEVTVVTHRLRVDGTNAADLFAAYDIVVDCTDNIAAKYLLADMCTRIGKPLVYGTIVGYEGYVTTFVPGGVTLRDVFGDMPEPGQVPSPAIVGTFGPAVGVIGSLQAAEVLKWITGAGNLLDGRLLCADTRTMAFNVLTVGRARRAAE